MLQKSLQATGIVSLGTVDRGVGGVMVFQVVGATWTGSALVKVRVGGPTLAGTPIPDANLKTIPYYNVATGTVIAPGTAITADGIFAVIANSLEVVLDYTHSAGAAAIYGLPAEIATALVLGTLVGDTTNGLFVQAKARAATVKQTSLNGTAAQIVAANANRASLIIENQDATNPVFLGTSAGVLTTTGIKLAAGASLTLSSSSDAWFGITASATVVVGSVET